MIDMSSRLSRECITLTSLDDDDLAHEMDDSAKVRRFTRALRSGAAIPPVFVIRQGDQHLLIQGVEQTAAADKLGIEELNAIVFNSLSDAESDEVGAAGFDMAESGCDVWSGLQLLGRRMGRRAPTLAAATA